MLHKPKISAASSGHSLDLQKGERLTAEEINFKRLLRKCQQIATDGETAEWRFPAYVAALEQMWAALKNNTDKQKRNESLTKRIAAYELNLDYLRKLTNPLEQTQEGQRRELLDIRAQPTTARAAQDPSEELSPNRKFHNSPSIESRNVLPVTTSSPVLHGPSGKKNQVAEREELLGARDNMDVLVTNEMNRQEEIAEEMLNLTRALKENAATANQLVKRDFKVIDKATSLADKNVVRLAKESEKLAEQTKKNTGFWVLFALIGLFGIFVMMVLFMRLFPKPRTPRT